MAYLADSFYYLIIVIQGNNLNIWTEKLSFLRKTWKYRILEKKSRMFPLLQNGKCRGNDISVIKAYLTAGYFDNGSHSKHQIL